MRSASQIKTAYDSADGCLRKWSYQYVLGLKPPSTGAQAFGSEVHAALEAILKGKKGEGKPDVLKAVGLILPRLPALGGRFLVEHAFEQDGIRGFIDLVDQDSQVIYDHKNTKDERYVKSISDLYEDEQAIIYANWGLKYFGIDRIRLVWNYVICPVEKAGQDRPRRPSKVVTQDMWFNSSHVQPRYEALLRQSAALEGYKANSVTPDRLPPNEHACFAYGGCPFLEPCGRLHISGIKAAWGNSDKRTSHNSNNKKERIDKMGLLEKMRAIHNPADPKGANPPEAADPLPVTPKEPEPRVDPATATSPAPRRGRPPKNKPEPEKAVETEAPKPVAEDPRKLELVVLLDAMFVDGGSGTSLATILAPMMDKIAEDNKVPHWSLVDYGKGSGLLAVALQRHLESLTGYNVFYVDSRSSGARAVLDTLLSRATTVIRSCC
jgi:hypothetical protein